jgi:hypothetical protein
MREEVAEYVFGHNADIALDMIIKDEFGSNSRLVLTTSAIPSLD